MILINENCAEANNQLVRIKREVYDSYYDNVTNYNATSDNYNDNDTNFDCNDTISSGDCGFTNDPCAVVSFDVYLFRDEDDDEGIPIARLQKKQSVESDACSIDVCIPCLADTGISVSKARRPVDQTKNRNQRSTMYLEGNRSFI